MQFREFEEPGKPRSAAFVPVQERVQSGVILTLVLCDSGHCREIESQKKTEGVWRRIHMLDRPLEPLRPLIEGHPMPRRLMGGLTVWVLKSRSDSVVTENWQTWKLEKLYPDLKLMMSRRRTLLEQSLP